jgi:hypothetical protein
MLRFSGIPLAAFAPSVRSDRGGSQVWRVMFSRPYKYEYWYNHTPWHRRYGTYHLRGQPCPPVWGADRRHET